MESYVRFSVPGGIAPALVYEPHGGGALGTVLLYHGLGAAKETQRKELAWLAEAGLRGICIDARHHGERADGVLELLAADPNPHFRVMKIVHDTAMEIPAIVDTCLSAYGGKIGIAGISLGGFIAYAAVPIEKRLQACVPILASPDWAPRQGEPVTDDLRRLLDDAPSNRPQLFPPCALLAANAGKDIHVPPGGSREFVQRLATEYRRTPERLKYLEYPESEHMMREEDWARLWDEAIGWLRSFLA